MLKRTWLHAVCYVLLLSFIVLSLPGPALFASSSGELVQLSEIENDMNIIGVFPSPNARENKLVYATGESIYISEPGMAYKVIRTTYPLYRSADYGKTWKYVDIDPKENSPSEKTGISNIGFTKEGSLLVSVFKRDMTSSWLSQDGIQWTKTEPGGVKLEYDQAVLNGQGTKASSTRDNGNAQWMGRNKAVFFDGYSIKVTKDYGKNWDNLSIKEYTLIRSGYVLDENTILGLDVKKGLFFCQLDGTVRPIKLTVQPENTDYLGPYGDLRMITEYDGSRTFVYYNPGIQSNPRVETMPYIFYSRDDGATWKQVDLKAFEVDPNGASMRITSLSAAPDGYLAVTYGNGNLSLLYDYGTRWAPRKSFGLNGSKVTCISAGDQALIYITDKGVIPKQTNYIMSWDSPKKWEAPEPAINYCLYWFEKPGTVSTESASIPTVSVQKPAVTTNTVKTVTPLKQTPVKKAGKK